MNAMLPAVAIPANASTPATVEALPLADSLLNTVARAMADPSTDVTKLEMLLRFQREIVAEEARLQFAQAMRAAQAEMQPILRSAQNTHTNSKYAPLEVIDAAIRPIYIKHGFGMEFDSEPIEGGVRLICEVNHAGGHMKIRRLEAALDTAGPKGSGNKTPVQALVSSTTYLRRTLTCMVWNIVMTNEDTDGNRQQSPQTPANDGRMTESQLAVLEVLMKQTQTGEGKFLAHHELDYRSIQQVPADEFIRLKNSLLAKKNVLQQRADLAAKARATAARQPLNGDAR